MKKNLILLAVFVVMLSACTAKYDRTDNDIETIASPISTSAGVTEKTEETLPYTASFEIYTNGTKRIFTAPMYHNQSQSVYIEASDPSIIQIKSSDVTWDDFFKTLPFSLTKDCLVTGTKQTFCNSEVGSLKFILNGKEVPEALDLIINPGDNLEVRYGN